MKAQISAVLVDSDATSSKQILETFRSLEQEVRLLAAASNLQEGMKIIQASTPHIIILEVKDLERGVRDIELLHSHSPRSAIFVISAEKGSEWILRLIRAGASEYLTRPVSLSELLDAVRKVARVQTVKNAQGSKRGEVVSVYNPSGGMGTTTVAVNLAATLAAQGHSTALVDLNLLSRDISAFLDLAPRYALDSVQSKIGLVDASFLKSILVPHSSGVQVLDGPENLLEAGKIAPELIREVIALLHTIFDYTVIDTGGELFGCNLATFGHSDKILFNTVLNLPSLRNAKRYLAALQEEGFGRGRVKLVLNRHTPKEDIRVSDAEKVLSTKAYQTLPNCYTDVKSSINKGVPLVQCYPKSPFTKAMEQMARQLSLDSNGSSQAQAL